MVVREPILVKGKIAGYDCVIQSYAQAEGGNSTDYLVQATRCLVVLVENKDGSITPTVTPSFIDRAGKITPTAPKDTSDLQSYQSLYHASVWRYAGVVEEEVAEEVLDKVTGELIETGRKVKTGQLIPSGLKTKTFMQNITAAEKEE